MWRYTSKEDPYANKVAKDWVYRQVDIHSEAQFRLAFHVYSRNASTYLAMDDITYTIGSCTNATTVTSTTPSHTDLQYLSCDFESITFCNWQNNASFPWKFNNINVQLLPMMPTVDHTKQNVMGRYVYVYHDQTNAATNSSNSAVMSIDSNYLGAICVSFWYYMRTNGRSQINVTLAAPGVPNPVIALRTNDKGEQWNLFTLDANEQGNGYIITISALVSYGSAKKLVLHNKI
jgi:hypothetical protein